MKINNILYFDHQATTPVDHSVMVRMMPFYNDIFGNPHSSEHCMGWEAAKAVEEATISIAALVGSDPDEIIFTSGATEANNLAILGLVRKNADRTRNKILVSAIEHKSILAAAEHVKNVYDYDLEIIPVDNIGLVDLTVLKAKISTEVLLVSIMAVNNEIGTIQQFNKIGALCREYGVLFHCDAAQIFPGLDIDVNRDFIDLLSLSAHKMYGPKGIGALFISRHLQRQVEPLIWGGGQQNNLRSGTSPVPLCVGMGEAARLMLSEPLQQSSCLTTVRNRLADGLIKACKGVHLNGADYSQRHPGNANLCFPGYSAQDILATLQPHLAASTGSACTSGIVGASYVLRAIGLTEELANCSLRFSLGRFTTNENVDLAISLIVSALNSLDQI